MQLAVSTRNARLDAIETEIGLAPTLKIRTGAPPSTCAAADSGSELVSMILPSDYLDAAASGSKAKSASAWTATATGAGTAGHFRIYTGAICKIQGTCGLASGDMALDNTAIAIGQAVTVTAFTLTDANS